MEFALHSISKYIIEHPKLDVITQRLVRNPNSKIYRESFKKSCILRISLNYLINLKILSKSYSNVKVVGFTR